MKRFRLALALALSATFALSLLFSVGVPAPPGADEKLARLDARLRDVSDLYLRMLIATLSEQRWVREREGILAEARQVRRRIDELPRAGSPCPAARHALDAAARLLETAPPRFRWGPHGEFAGAIDPATGRRIRGPDGRPFGFPAMYLYLDDARELARRADAAGIRLPELSASPDDFRPILRAEPEPPVASKPAPRNPRVEEARKLLAEADRRWDEISDRESPALYRRLLKEYPETLEALRAGSRVRSRAGAD